MKKGCIHIYCGDGKGKTTAAIGLSVRAAGRGMKVLIARFLKTDDSGEVPMLANISGVCVKPCLKTFGFYYKMTDEQKTEAAEYYENLFEETWSQAVDENYDLVIFDEIMAACRYGFVPERRLVSLLKGKPEKLEVVMTGRDPSEELISLADYVSEVRMVKHPFEKGITAREGIEY